MKKQDGKELEAAIEETLAAACDVADNARDTWAGYDMDRNYMNRLVAAVKALRERAQKKPEA